MKTDDTSSAAWPLTSDNAKQALEAVIDLLFEPVLQKTLIEWGQLRQRCRLKGLKRQAIGRIAGKMHSAETHEQLADRLGQATPEEAFALLQALSWLTTAEHPNLVLMAPYRDEADHRERWYAVVVHKTLEWAQEQRQLFEADDWMGYRD